MQKTDPNTLDTDGDILRNPLSISPFLLKDTLHAIALDAVRVGHARSTLSVARGDPLYMANHQAKQALALMTKAAADISVLLATEEDGSLCALVEQAWQSACGAAAPQVVAWADQIILAAAEAMEDGTAGDARANLLSALARHLGGEGYGDPQGEPVIRTLVARHMEEHVLGLPIGHLPTSEVVLTDGAGGAIGATLNAQVAAGYLRSGDTVAMVAPLYAPYQEVCQKLGLNLLLLHCRSEAGYIPDETDLEQFAIAAAATPFKLLIVVEPSNPTGRPMPPAVVDAAAQIVREQRAVVLLDIVYQELLDAPTTQYTLAHALPEQTLIIYSLSKAYCQTGSRVGAIATTAGGATWIGMCMGFTLPLRRALVRAKDANGGATAHVTMVPPAQQWKAITHLLLGEEHLRRWRAELKHRYSAFCQGLGLPIPLGLGQAVVPYYLMVDLAELVTDWSQEVAFKCLRAQMDAGEVSPGDALRALAEAGVEVLYAARFFPQREEAHRWLVRISVANQPVPALREVAVRTRAALRALTLQSTNRLAA